MRAERTRRTKDTATASSSPVAPEPGLAETASTINGQAKNATTAEAKEERAPFFELIRSFGDRWETEGLKLYLWRVWPRIDKGEDHHYLITSREPLDEEQILRTHGSGRYMLIVRNSQGKQVAKHTFSIRNPAFPPAVNEAEVVRCPENDLYFQLWSKRPNSSGTKPEEAQEARNEVDLAAVVREAKAGSNIDPQVISFLKETAQGRDALASKVAEANAKDPIEDLTALARAFKELLPPASPTAPPPQTIDPVGMFTAMGDVLGKIQRPIAREQSVQQPASPLQHVRETVELFTQVRDLITPEPSPATAAPVSTGEMAGWQAMVSSLGQSISSALPGIASLITAWKTPIGQQGPAHAGMPYTPPQAWNPYENPGASRQFVQQQQATGAPTAVGTSSGNQQPAQPQPAPATPTDGPVAPVADAVAELYQHAIFLINTAVNCLSRGVSGYEAADSIVALNGDLEYRRLVAQIKRPASRV